MSIKCKECCEQTLFVIVDTDFKNENQVKFSLIPKVQNNMVPMYLNTYAGQYIESYFHQDAVLWGNSSVWDTATQSVMNSDEAFLQSFQEFDKDFLAKKYDTSEKSFKHFAPDFAWKCSKTLFLLNLNFNFFTLLIFLENAHFLYTINFWYFFAQNIFNCSYYLVFTK